MRAKERSRNEHFKGTVQFGLTPYRINPGDPDRRRESLNAYKVLIQRESIQLEGWREMLWLTMPQNRVKERNVNVKIIPMTIG